MTRKQVFCLLLAGTLGFLNGAAALAQEAARKPHVPLEKTIGQTSHQAPMSSLLVLNADGAKLEGNKLTLTGVASSTIVFSDRPVRAAGHLATDELVKQWGEGPDNFVKDPPNATISVLGGGSDVSDAVLTLKTPTLEGTTLTFDVAVLEGNLDGASGPAALFIDHWRGWNNAAWYGAGLATGAALGVAATRPYYPPHYYRPYYYAPVVERPCPPGYWLGPWGHCRDTPYHGRLPGGGWQP
ncbi:hypothetical protein MRS76_24830 [Rhizobiaceae bacterium n13]|uniref:Uncharacterized protein n=1 Tax=Ferirhizobium litorale TaxID=2927786 RepID=A0AAE3QF63_9HYPH|nr:hypothetical protein [Fererhizobium litorale]MDI7865138.1 hypothetical protein [Fererhizobium litorale]MDI7922890.1 hypothetical protein [Fererhizobium litorale]